MVSNHARPVSLFSSLDHAALQLVKLDQQLRPSINSKTRQTVSESGMTQPVIKKLLLYRNGDVSFRPIHYTYSNRKIRLFDKLLEDIEERVPPLRGGGVRCLYTVDGTKRITSIDDLTATQEEKFVVCGPETYKPVPGGYENIFHKGISPNGNAETGYRDMNKRVFGERDSRARSLGDMSQGKKIMIMRHGVDDKPIQYIYRPRITRSWEKFLEELTKIAPPKEGGMVTSVYTINGHAVTYFDQLKAGEIYVVTGEHGSDDSKENHHNSMPRPEMSSLSAPELLHGNTMTSTLSPRSPRPPEHRVYNRIDQIRPEALFIFVFRNGNGMQAYRYVFTPKQLDKGMPWVLEQIAKRYDVYPQRICAMDGKPVPTVDEFENKGAYVLIPLGEKFRDTWYFLPDGSLDTSRGARKERQKALTANPNGSLTSIRREATVGAIGLQRNRINRSRSNNDLAQVGRMVSPERENSETESGQNFLEDQYNSHQNYEHRQPEEYEEQHDAQLGQNHSHNPRATHQGQELEHEGRHVHTSYGRPVSSASNCSHCAALEDRLVSHHKQHMQSSINRHRRPETANNSRNAPVRAVRNGSIAPNDQVKQMLRYSKMSRNAANSERTSPVPRGNMTRSQSNLDEGQY